MKVHDLRQKCEEKVQLGRDKRHNRGGMRQKSGKMSCLGRNNQEYKCLRRNNQEYKSLGRTRAPILCPMKLTLVTPFLPEGKYKGI